MDPIGIVICYFSSPRGISNGLGWSKIDTDRKAVQSLQDQNPGCGQFTRSLTKSNQTTPKEMDFLSWIGLEVLAFALWFIAPLVRSVFWRLVKHAVEFFFVATYVVKCFDCRAQSHSADSSSQRVASTFSSSAVGKSSCTIHPSLSTKNFLGM